MVEDADCEILLSADSRPLSDNEFAQMIELMKFSGRSFIKLYDSARFKDWVDESRVRTTFYGRFTWHDRIHGKAITRMLEKQRQLGVIDKYDDPFRLKIGSEIGEHL